VTTFFSKNAKNLQSGKPSQEYWVTIFFLKMSDYEITQDTGLQLVERYKKNEIVTGFENVRYIRERIHNIWVIR